MTSTKDVQDMLGLPASGAPKPPPLKKQKTSLAQPRQRLSGISREVQALHGERAPPIVIQDSAKTFYRRKIQPSLNFRPSRWELKPFTNSARSDGLVLRHWRKAVLPKTPAAPADDSLDKMEEDEKVQAESEYEFAKYNVEVTVPNYTDEEYDKLLQDKNWSKEETDYLVDMVKEWSQRWYLVYDRYEFMPKQPALENGADPPSESALAVKPPQRSMEELKARYYQISAKMMAATTPGGVANMDDAEFSLHSILTSFDPLQETRRKQHAEKLFYRSLEEVKEEEYLLHELQRIAASTERLEQERAQLRELLEVPRAKDTQGLGPTGGMWHSSASLNNLFTTLFQRDRKNRGRLSLASGDVISPANGPGSATANGHHPGASISHRDSLTGSGSAQKKGSTAAAASAPQVRQLSPRTEAKFGITSHERLTSGVTFRTDKMLKLRQAKSQVQTQKIAGILGELGIPELMQLPTANVCDGMERLVQKVGKLIEARKVAEKEEGELKVLEKEEEERRRRETGDTGAGETDSRPEAQEGKDEAVPTTNGTAEAKANGEQSAADGATGADADVDADGEADAEGEEEDVKMETVEEEASKSRPASLAGHMKAPPAAEDHAAIGPAATTRSGHKRSASVLSQASSKASRSSKRTKK